jgi:hypothetical protein
MSIEDGVYLSILTIALSTIATVLANELLLRLKRRKSGGGSEMPRDGSADPA